MVVLTASIIIILSLLLTYYYWNQRKLPPGPWGIPIFGYLPWLDPKKPYISLTKLSKKYGPIYGVNLGSVYTVVLSDSKLIREAFAKNVYTGRAPLYVTHGIMKGYGLICAEGELWKDQRKFVASCLKDLGMSKFGSNRYKMESWILKSVQEFIHIVNTNISQRKNEFDPHHFLQHCVGNYMNYMVFGLQWEIDDPTWIWLQQLQEEGTKYIGVAGPLNFIPFLRYVPFMQNPLEFLIEGKNKTHDLYRKIISDYANTRDPNSILNDSNNKQPDSFDNSEIHRNHFIEAFLKERETRKNDPSEKLFCDEQFLHLLADLFGAGLDTTLTTLRWFLLYVAKNQEIQEKIYEELIGVTGKKRIPCLDDIKQLPLFESAIAETQRIRSVVPVGIPHGSIEESVFNGYRIPQGTMIVPLQWAVHMDSKLWINPEEFNPQRFINDSGKFEKPEFLIPFQTGKRMCVGEELGKMMLFVYGFNILNNFHIALEENFHDFDGICGITLTPSNYKLKFTKRA